MANDTAAGARRRREEAGDGRRRGGDALVLRTLAGGLTMLSLFDAEHRQWSLDQMVARLGVSRMTGYRMARTLQSTGHLVFEQQTGRYHLGPAMLAGIYLAEDFAQLVTVSRPYLESLMKETGELAALAVELDGVAVCVDLVASARPFVPEIAMGRPIGDTANAHGKMFAAMKPDVERARIVCRPHERLTPATITDPDELAAELEKIRSDGLAFDLEEHDLGTCAVVAPVRNQMGEVIATLGVVVPTGRFGPDARTACAEAVTAASLSEFYGYSPPVSRRGGAGTQ
jgi:DNA-binding IclR family transcriptional regulator